MQTIVAYKPEFEEPSVYYVTFIISYNFYHKASNAWNIIFFL